MDRAENVRQSATLLCDPRWRRQATAAAGASLLEAPGRLGEPASKLGVSDMRLRLRRQPARDFVHVATRLGDHVIDIDRKLTGMNRQKLTSAAALLVSGPVG